MRFKVKVPASTSNLGAGFDALGVALELYNIFEVETSSDYEIEVTGESSEHISKDPSSNLFMKVYRKTIAYLGHEETPIKVRIKNSVPVGRGLGSSATAIVAGILSAFKVSGKEVSQESFMDVALEFESHPDNIVPSFVGGLVVCATNGEVKFLKLNWPEDLKFVIVSPEIVIPTEKARAVLPESYSLKDVVFNVQRTALFVGALLSGRYELLKEAVRDRIHQPYRSELIPGFWEAITEGYKAGALSVFLSGAGSCIGAIVKDNGELVGNAIKSVFEAMGVDAKFFILGVDKNGAVLET